MTGREMQDETCKSLSFMVVGLIVLGAIFVANGVILGTIPLGIGLVSLGTSLGVRFADWLWWRRNGND